MSVAGCVSFLVRRKRGLAVVALLCLSAPTIAESTISQTSEFPIFDALTYKGKPDSSALSLRKIHLIDRNPDKSEPPNEEGVRQIVAEISKTEASPVIVFDIEGFQHPTEIRRDAKSAVDAELAYLNQLVFWAKSTNKSVKVGFFAIMPRVDYWTPNLYRAATENPTDSRWSADTANIQTHMKNLMKANAYVAALADKVDFIYPELYTPYDSYKGNPFGVNYHGWEQFAAFTISEARKYHKPVYPFVFNGFIDGAATVYRFRKPAFDPAIGPFPGWRPMSYSCPDGLWSKEIAYLRAHADGMVLWGTGSFLRQTWNDVADWWQETVKNLSDNCGG
ncbi:exported hypothetical protein [Gammaproteobacteria bacterium]